MNKLYRAGGMAVVWTALFVTPVLAKKAEGNVTPGKRIGGVVIGADAKTLEKFGASDTGDGAMQKAWMTWFSKPKAGEPNAVPAELDVYVVPAPGGDGAQKVIEKVRATSSMFKLSNGIGPGSSFERIKRTYPHLKLIKTYTTKKSNGPIQIYDDVKIGVAFEIYRGRDGKAATGQCSAIIVHRRGGNAEEGYMPLSGYLEGIADTKVSR